MNQIGDFFVLFLSQFAGGPGPPENNLARFGLAALFWGILLIIAISRQRQQNLPREKWLLLGFSLAFIRELFMLGHLSIRLMSETTHDVSCTIIAPIEHTLTLAAFVVISGSFLRFILDDINLARRYIWFGAGATAVGLITTFLWWPQELAKNPAIQFHETWQSWFIHLLAGGLIGLAIFTLIKREGWVRNVIIIAFSFFLLSEILFLINAFTSREYTQILCPLSNSFYLWAIPLFGYVYYREQADEKKEADLALQAYRNHLEDLVEARTTQLSEVNEKLCLEIKERRQTETKLSRRNDTLAAQNEIAATISQALDVETVLEMALVKSLDLLQMKRGCIFLLDEADKSLALKVYLERNSTLAPDQFEGEGPVTCLCQEICHQAMLKMKPIVRHRLDQEKWQEILFDSVARSNTLVATPLVAQGRAVGALALGRDTAEGLLSTDIKLLTAVGQQIGMAVENAHLHKEMAKAAALEERQLIAAEMHDGLAQTLSYLGLKTDHLLKLIQTGSTKQANDEVSDMQTAIDQAILEVRHSIASLHEAPSPPRPLPEIIDHLITVNGWQHILPIHIQSQLPDPPFLTADILEHVERVIHESVLNALRHAAASQLLIKLGKENGLFKIEIVDDGCGFNPAANDSDGEAHFGLSIMRARATRIGGMLGIDSKPGCGTRVTLIWPADNTPLLPEDEHGRAPPQAVPALSQYSRIKDSYHEKDTCTPGR